MPQRVELEWRGAPPPGRWAVNGGFELDDETSVTPTDRGPVRGFEPVRFRSRDPFPERREATFYAMPGYVQARWEIREEVAGARPDIVHLDGGDVPVSEDEPIELKEPPVARVSGDIRFEGENLDAHWPEPVRDHTTWSLSVGPSWSDEHDITSLVQPTSDSYTYDETLHHETYDVYFEFHSGPGDDVEAESAVYPGDIEGRVEVAGEIEVAGDRTLDLEVELARVHGRVSFRGGAIPEGARGDDTPLKLRYVDVDSGETFEQPIRVGDETYQSWVYPGTYDVYASLDTDHLGERPFEGAKRVGDQPVRVADALEIGSEQRLDIDLAPVQTTLAPRWNGRPLGEAPPHSDNDERKIRLEGAGGATYSFHLEPGTDRRKVWVYPGRYGVWVDLPIDAGGWVRAERDLRIRGGGTHTFEVETVEVSVADHELYRRVEHRTYETSIVRLADERVRSDHSDSHHLNVSDFDLEEGSVTVYEGTYDIETAITFGEGAYGKSESVLIRRRWRAGSEPLPVEQPIRSVVVEANSPAIPSYDDEGEFASWKLSFRRRPRHPGDFDDGYVRAFRGRTERGRISMHAGIYDVYFQHPKTGHEIRVARCIEIEAED